METIARGITYTDLKFLGRQGVIATAILQGSDGVALVDPGPSTCLDELRSSLADQGLSLLDVRVLLLTHIHLDHAGASGSLLKENPEIVVYVHERGAPHMIAPAKLMASAARLYGDDMDRLWGEMLAVPEANIRRLSGGERLEVAGCELEVAYVPGHASHHVGYFDRSSGIAFIGDTAGVRIGAELFAMPPTPPPDIDIEKWFQSLALIHKWHPSTLFITHFGPHENADAHLDAMREHLNSMSAMARRSLELDGDDNHRMQTFVAEMGAYLQRHVSPSEAALYDYAAPLTLCWMGLARYWRKRGVGVS